MAHSAQPAAAAAPVARESQPLLSFRGLHVEDLASIALVVTYGCLYCGTSAALISYNKYLIHEDRFPFAVPLVLMHTVFCSVFTGGLFLACPSLFPSLTDPARKVAVDRDLILRGGLPIAVCFAAQLALSNTAYLHSSVAFLQMMKEANLALVYVLSLSLALEQFRWRNARILVVILFATVLTVHGELHFSMQGFVIQGVSQLFECVKIVLQAMLLSKAGKKLDALTYVLLVMPICLVVLSCALLVSVFLLPNQHIATPTWEHCVVWWPHLAINACMAFVLNVVIALFVKHSSAISFILAGIVKDAGIVLVGGFVLREVISVQQAIGFAVQLGSIVAYTLVRAAPEDVPEAAPGAQDYGAMEGGEKGCGSPGAGDKACGGTY